MKEIIEKIGLTSGETKVYLALLDLGESSIGAILKESKVSHSKVYDILERLSDKGLVTIIRKHNVQHFLANDPKSLNEYLDLQKKDIDDKKEELAKIMPLLKTKLQFAGPKDEVTIYEGKTGIIRFTESVLKTLKKGETFYLLGTPVSSYDVMGEYFTGWQRRRTELGIKAKMLFNEEARERGEVRKKLPCTKIKYIPNDLAPAALTEFFGDYFAIMVLIGKPVVFVVRNKILVESYKKQFEYLWKIAEN
jgi:HTH-type transcriptional regulator, sugar sensing transcriptional regulator